MIQNASNRLGFIMLVIIMIVIMNNSCITVSTVDQARCGQSGGSSSSICITSACPFIVLCSCVAEPAARVVSMTANESMNLLMRTDACAANARSGSGGRRRLVSFFGGERRRHFRGRWGGVGRR
jgi:hypothetical protein